ncbi:hypothetical protein JOE58_001021 [Curtobacterium luteum]|uniref:Uncharacterized protein n=1 Tax=Curtobacterium luteum TaxID=33881 RepID=A0A8H9G8U0_9MICO|nr:MULTISPECIES: hypothetical protein [Curtobacterium]MBM7801770.1 hypothetical protein [Curtobacterium luteum]NUU51911.1 hypothetical protein [Curtobacterium luteum]GGK87828.1 hypothetical protein GCM10009769_02330 [Curtobacterium luteum]
MPILKPLPDAMDPDRDDDEYWAYENGATVPEYLEWRRTGVLTVSMRVKWWWRRTRRVLR